MFFLISKLFWIVAEPLAVVTGLVVSGALLLVVGRVRAGRALVVVGAAVLVTLGILPVGTLLLRPLEERFPPLAADEPAPTGIIVLGGSTDQNLTLARRRVAIADAAERLTEAVALARRYPEARIVFTGGSASLIGSEDSEAADARRLWTSMGLAEARITTEDRSRNTDENVRFTRRIVQPQPGQRWILVTSAFHMPRAVALFRANDWPVVPDPVDYRTTGDAHDWRPAIGGNLSRASIALREWIGLVVYRLSGRTRTLLPDP